MGLDFNVVPEFLDLILIGAMWTISITLVAAAISLVGGVLFAVIALYGHWLVRYPVKFFAWLFMGTPLLLQLFLIYFGLVQVGIDLP
ncbi:MAG: ABC transporter permease subunit, partial [OCS116 cluster bacterium]|nr:ABC transporter permease subunit [OCS116 cluster bacterium]